MKYVIHPLIRPNSVVEREYQMDVVNKALKKNLLVILPTGLGKTTIALLLSARLLYEKPDMKVLMVAPTRPLVEQHANYFRSNLVIDSDSITTLTGRVSPSLRKEIWKRAKVVFATPQVVLNDLLSGKAEIGDRCLVIFDEAHRAVGNHPYVRTASFILRMCKKAKISGLTASPGNEKRIEEIKRN